ncbi:hypothetical protein BDQ12DRAFT_635810 [Crucibulum laeve]|uniref:ABC transporter domain-containing protein n=1 Tax=Crucibulum laeve TaxID=68775 RepID=A0A5C3LPQ7_9AGAR|nr:hypothetical protein BDQ12DRAFT_635810 [Crucibulum laeve]
MKAAWYTLLFVALVLGQACENYGIQGGSNCSCPTGFGGSSCSQPACGGNIFQGTQRALTPVSSGSFANLTAAGCSCQDGWTGTGCNVCQNSNACQSAYSASGHSSSDSSSIAGAQNGQNNSLTCNTAARVWASGQMSCQVDNPTLQTLYPLKTTLNIIRTLEPSLSPLPNTTSFGSSGTAFAQLFYEGVEQFYCQADSCKQDLGNSNDGSANWECSNLQCTCRPNTTFCGGVPASNLTGAINPLSGSLGIECGAVDSSSNTAACHFKQTTLQALFGSEGLSLNGCTFGECVRQSVIDTGGTTGDPASEMSSGRPLSGGVIAGLAVVGSLILISLLLLFFGWWKQRAAKRSRGHGFERSRVSVEWSDLSYIVPGLNRKNAVLAALQRKKAGSAAVNDDKVILDSVSGRVQPGQMMAILGPSGAGKTTLVELLAGKSKTGLTTGRVFFPSSSASSSPPPRIGFVPQQDVLPPTLTVYEALLFGARLRLPESVSDLEKHEKVEELMEKLGISSIRDTRIGYSGNAGGGRTRGISGGEMRRVSIGLELIASPDVLILDEPTSGLDSVSASRVASVLHSIAHDPVNPTPVIASIHQPSSQLYQKFDTILLLAHGRALYSGPGAFAPAEYFATSAPGTVPPYQNGYNVADYLLEVASDPPVALFQLHSNANTRSGRTPSHEHTSEKASLGADTGSTSRVDGAPSLPVEKSVGGKESRMFKTGGRARYATTFLTQLQYLSGREWKILRRDKTLFFTHVAVSAVLGVFCGGLYFNTDITIAGFQSRVGCLFFLGALIAFSSLSALYNIVEIRPLFLRERSSSYYSPTAWLLSRFFFDMIPLRLIPTIIVSTITYWMAGLAADAAHFFKFLFILVLYSLAMTLFNFLLGTLFHNGGIAILLSALSALYQMTFAGFFVHLSAIPPVLRWLQWLCPLKYTLEALSVNEVSSGLMIQDTLQGVPVSISASLIMNLLFGFGLNNYYRDVLVLFGFIAGFGLGVIGVVWFKVRERR